MATHLIEQSRPFERCRGLMRECRKEVVVLRRVCVPRALRAEEHFAGIEQGNCFWVECFVQYLADFSRHRIEFGIAVEHLAQALEHVRIIVGIFEKYPVRHPLEILLDNRNRKYADDQHEARRDRCQEGHPDREQLLDQYKERCVGSYNDRKEQCKDEAALDGAPYIEEFVAIDDIKNKRGQQQREYWANCVKEKNT